MDKKKEIIIFVVMIVFIILITISGKPKKQSDNYQDDIKQDIPTNLVYDEQTGEYVVYDEITGDEIARDINKTKVSVYLDDPEYNPRNPDEDDVLIEE